MKKEGRGGKRKWWWLLRGTNRERVRKRGSGGVCV